MKRAELMKLWKEFKQNPQAYREKFKYSINSFINIKELVLCLTSRCNLKCKHCSYLCNPLPEQEADLHKLKEIINEALSLGIKQIVIAGKEPLADIKRTTEILELLIKKKAKFGLVTNGTLIEKHIQDLEKFKFSYFDVSIDGTRDYHDKTRGAGNFIQAKEGIQLALKKNIAETFFISSVLMSYNYKDILNMIKEFNKLGVKNYSLGIYVYTGFNPKEWILKKEQLVELIELLKGLKYFQGQIIIDIHTQVNDYWDFLVEKNIIKEENVKMDSHNNIYFQIPNTKIFLKNSMFTTNFWNTVIITADGYYLDDYEYEAYPNYRDYVLGNVQDMSFKEYLEKVKEKSSERFLSKIQKYISTSH